MLQLIRQNRFYFLCLALFFVATGIILLNSERGDAVLLFNKYHQPITDKLFYYITYLGDGRLVVALLIILLLFKNIYQGLVLGISVLNTFLVIQFLKIYIFEELARPSVYFPKETNLHFVDGLEMHLYHSFPSGHAGQNFAIFMICSLLVKNKNWSFLFFLLAFLGAISRVYLAQHFLIDIYFGALIGSLVSFTTYYYLINYTKLSTIQRLQKGWIV